MVHSPIITNRIAVIAEIIDQAPLRIGRTALMKLCYFLQVLRQVELGYRFTLYSYGPFDSDVLADLQLAESMGVIDSEMVTYSGGYQYHLSTTESFRVTRRYARKFLDQNSFPIKWVVETFASRSASELELLSTIIYVNREKRPLSRLALRDRVKHIKPHFTNSAIEEKVDFLDSLSLLQ